MTSSTNATSTHDDDSHRRLFTHVVVDSEVCTTGSYKAKFVVIWARYPTESIFAEQG
jgi:hypothetical protein